MNLQNTEKHLAKLQSADDLRRFLRDLGYDAQFDAEYFLPAQTKADVRAQNLLAGELEVVAAHGDFRVFYGRLKGKLSISDERAIVERLLADKNDYALFVFSDASQKNWRFLNVKRDAKSAARRRIFRRFSVDAAQSIGRTTLERLGSLDLSGKKLEPLETQVLHESAFDVEAVTRNFYEEYEKIFARVKAQIKPKPGLQFDEIARHDWTQRLFNRLMFLRFLERKGWLLFEGKPDYLRELFRAAVKANENFLQDRLYFAFFYGLGFREDKPPAGPEAENAERELRKTRGDVPFLNGGLFTEVQLTDSRGEIELSNQISGEILDFLDGFNFTISESTPLDVEVAVDPEMLGKVFEELVTSRNDDGAYYTPRTVVSFMARESIKRHLSHTTGETEGAVSLFVDDGDVFGLKNREKVFYALRDISICDPACGSGAYLLGAMSELLRLRNALFAVEQLDAPTLYERKLEIISANLYGVDRSEFATNIAMLRLWLSLVIDFDGPRDQIPALPNLGYKIGCGDSLAADDPLGQSIGRDEYLPHAQTLAALHHEWLEHGIQQKRGFKVRTYSEIKGEIDGEIAAVHALFGDSVPVGAFDWRAGFAEVFARGGFDVVVANPPYGGTSVSENTRVAYFGNERQAKDPYGIFMARGLQLLKDGGTFSFIVSDTWRTIKSHKPLRRLILDKTSVAHVIDLPAWIFGATVNTSILTFQKGAPDAKHEMVAVDLRPIPSGDWNALGLNLLAVAVRGRDAQTLSYARYTFAQSLIAGYDNLSFFIASPTLYKLMSDPKFQKLGAVAEVKQGLATADNEYYLRKRASARGSYRILDDAELLSSAEIAALSDKEKSDGVDPKKYGGRHFVPYDKGGAADIEGGWLPNYHVPTEYFIDWSKAAVKRLRTATIADVKRRKGELSKIKKGDESARAAVIRNPQFYFQKGVTFSPTGIYSPSFRLGTASVFGNKGSTIFFENPKFVESGLGYMTSTLARYFLKNYSSHTVETGEEVLTQLPLPKNADETAISQLVSSIIKKQEHSPRYEWWLDEGPQIDALVYALYGLGAAEIREIELWFCRRYERLARGQGVWARVETQTAAFLKSQIGRDAEL